MKPTTILATAVLLAGGGAIGVRAGLHDAQRPDPRTSIFVKHGCTECHAISALQLKSTADVGPDLTFAYADVVTRYGVNLESFLDRPIGVMGLVLSAHPRLSATDRDSVTRILKHLYAERGANLYPAVPAFPPATYFLRTRARVTHAVP